MVWRTALRALASLVVVAVALALAPAPPPSAQTPAASARQPKLVLAVQPTSTPEQLSADAKELREFLSQRLHREVEIVFPMTYAGVVEALRFGDVRFAGGYAQGWEALKAHQADVAIIAGDVSEMLYRDVLAGTRVIEQQGPIPSHAVLFARDLDQAVKTQLRDALLDLGQPQHRGLMRKLVSGIFVGFKVTTAELHLAALDKFLAQTQLAFVERLH